MKYKQLISTYQWPYSATATDHRNARAYGLGLVYFVTITAQVVLKM
jgi:hypothetical protein